MLLPRESPGLQLLQQVRDEAHRFALRGHRTRRAAGQTASLLDTLPGVGAVRRKALIAHFGDVARLLEASRSELEAVPGLPAAVGRDDLRPPPPRRWRQPVIDGGKGQLGAALDAMRSFDLPRVAVVSLAKREEEVYLPGRSHPVILPRESAGLQLLQQIRDEAHRFALRGHRTRRAAGQTSSLLDTLPGVGPVRRRALIGHFGDVARLLEASRSELEAVPGLPAAVGRAIYDHLHRVGGDGPAPE